jgi:hypothetical protein
MEIQKRRITLGIKVEHGKYYKTKGGWIVGPARQVNKPYPVSWALYLSEGKIFEIEGVTPEQAFQVELVQELSDNMNFYQGVEDRIATLEKVVVMELYEKVNHHEVFRVHSDVVLDSDVIQLIKRVQLKMKNEENQND